MVVVIVFVLVLLLLPHMVSKAHDSTCTIRELLSLPQEYYQPGDFLIGGLASHLIGSLDDEVFTEYLAISQMLNPM